MKKLLSIALLASALGMGSARTEAVTLTKSSDGVPGGQFRNPSEVSITVDPGLLTGIGLYLQTQPYTIPVLARPGAGWKPITAFYFNPAGQKVEIALDSGPLGDRQFLINIFPQQGGLRTIVTVRFATLRLTPAGTPDYMEDVTLFAQGAVPNLDALDLNGNGMSDTWERNYFGWENVNPLDDLDGDGLANLGESKIRTSPFLKDNPIVGLKVKVTIK
jgi:hypothetical protein